MVEALGERLYTTTEIAELIGAHINTVHRWAAAGTFGPKIYLQGRAHYNEKFIKDFLQGKASTSSKEDTTK